MRRLGYWDRGILELAVEPTRLIMLSALVTVDPPLHTGWNQKAAVERLHQKVVDRFYPTYRESAEVTREHFRYLEFGAAPFRSSLRTSGGGGILHMKKESYGAVNRRSGIRGPAEPRL
jgi:hypothetical protein